MANEQTDLHNNYPDEVRVIALDFGLIPEGSFLSSTLQPRPKGS